MRDQQGNEPPTVGEIKDAVFATSRKLTPEQEIIAGFRGMLKEEFTALIQKLRESANAIEDPGVRAQVERRVSALIEDINDARRRADARFGADTRKFSSRGEAFLKGRYGTIQREKEPLMARAKTAMTQVNDLEKALQGQDSALAIRLESCGQQSQTIQTIMQEIEQYASAIEKAMQEKNTGQLPSAIAALEKTFFLLNKEH
ncbi:hypothetical protein HY621_04240 [Candidatus Uhrbacteria bacterium]|nr:hypothetical protein [Candidatus Uhrbacteria bacterium]